MRSLLPAFCIALTALTPMPAMARENDGTAGEIAGKLNDPLTQYAVAGMLSAMSKAALDMRVEPFVQAIEEAGGKRQSKQPRDTTVADLAGADREKVRDGIIKHVPQAMSTMGAMAGALEKAMPRIEETAREMRDAAPRL